MSEILFDIPNKKIISTLSKEQIEDIFLKEDFDSYKLVKPIVIENENLKSEYYDETRTETTINRL